MNEQDKEAFIKWLESEIDTSFEGEFDKYAQYWSKQNNCWQAALEYERARSQKLVEVCEVILSHKQGDVFYRNALDCALQEYRVKE